MLIDARGMGHPDHIQAFRKEVEGTCSVNDDVEVLIDDKEDLGKRFEMFIRSCRISYTVEKVEGFLRIKIKAPFCMCG
ncbi:MAG: hypothetical protein HGA78_09540 [Nitrospirales bacterium]|nr:hypothetical protein [Nitrospirales bacterium]